MAVHRIWQILLVLYFNFIFKTAFAQDNASNSEDPVTEIIDVSEMEDSNTTSSIPTTSPTIKAVPIAVVPDSSQFYCTCDLTSSWCDVDCCCDPDCSGSDLKSFSSCTSSRHIVSKSRHCFRKTWFFHQSGEKSFRSTEESDGKFFCLVADNLKQKHYFHSPDTLASELDFQNLEHFSWTPTSVTSLQISNGPTRSGDPIAVVFYTDLLQAVPWTLPGSMISSFCETNIPVRYMLDQKSTCILTPADVRKSCGSPRLSSRYFHSSFMILGKTAVPQNQDSICGDKTCLTIRPRSLDLPSDSILAEDGLCHHAVQRVHYQVEHFGADGISAVQVIINTTVVKASDTFLQEFRVSFLWGNRTDVTIKRSGNPGYITGLPILVEPRNQSLFQVTEPLTIVGVRTDGTCAELDTDRTVVTFRHNRMTGCSLTVALPTNRSCHFLRCLSRNQLLGRDPPQHVASFGLHDSDHVRIVNVGDETSSASDPAGSCENVPEHLDLTVAYAATHTVEDPQMAVVGVQRRIRKASVFLHCAPSTERCQVYLASLSLTTTVSFSRTDSVAIRKFGGPPRLGGNLPKDFFYPFLTEGSISYILVPSKVWLCFGVFVQYALNNKKVYS